MSTSTPPPPPLPLLPWHSYFGCNFITKIKWKPKENWKACDIYVSTMIKNIFLRFTFLHTRLLQTLSQHNLKLLHSLTHHSTTYKIHTHTHTHTQCARCLFSCYILRCWFGFGLSWLYLNTVFSRILRQMSNINSSSQHARHEKFFFFLLLPFRL